MSRKFRKSIKLLGISLILVFFGCSLEQDAIEKHFGGLSKEPHVRIIKGREVNIVKNKLFREINKSGKINPIGERETSLRTSESGEIDFSQIMEVIDTLGIKNYTFKIINHPFDDDKTFHNLVLTEKDSLLEITVMKYEMTDEYAGLLVKNPDDFVYYLRKVSATSISNEINDCEEVVEVNPYTGGESGDNSGGGGYVGGDGGDTSGGSVGGGSDSDAASCMAISLSFVCGGNSTYGSCGNTFSSWDSYSSSVCGNGSYDLTIVINYTISDNCRTDSERCNPEGSIGVIQPVDSETPCQKLNKFITNNSIQQTLRILKGQSSGLAEHGNYINETINTAGASYLSFPIIPQNPNKPTSLNMNAGVTNGNVKGAMHCHTDPVTTGAVPMFSPGDLRTLRQIAHYHNNGQPKNYAEYTVMLSVGSGHYAIKFKNFNDFALKYASNFEAFDRYLNRLYTESSSTATSDTLIKNFLKALNNHDFGSVGLYKATEATDSSGVTNITGWKEQTLDVNGNINEVPCI